MYRFDFGVAKDKKYDANGITRIFGDTLYDASKGYGLTAATDGLAREHENDFLRDFLYLKDIAFKVDLPNGKYNVRIYSGDYGDYGDHSVMVQVSGERRGGMWVNDHNVNQRAMTIEVENGTVDFEFNRRGDTPVSINAIEIAEFSNVKPEGLVAKPIDGDKIDMKLTWDKADGATGYAVHCYHYDSDITRSYTCSENEFIDKEAELCETYTYTVKTCDKMGFESKDGVSLDVVIADGNPVPAKVSGLSVNVTEKSVSLKWDPTPGALGYYVYQKAEFGLYKKLGRVDITEFVDNDVLAAVEFVYAVSAITKSGLTERAEVTTPVKRAPFKRKMETLDRGAVALPAQTGGMFVSWRLNAYEYSKGLNFNVYRNGVKVNADLIENSTNFVDADGKVGDKYVIKAVLDGKEEKDGAAALLFEKEHMKVAVDKPAPFTAPDGNIYNYTINDLAVADLDGDGEYEIVLKWDCNGRDNSHSGFSGNVYIDAYKLNGTKMWRIDLGINIRGGAHYTQFLVYDFDGDGKAEVIFKTADGTTDSKGKVIGDKNADFRNDRGYILEGDEYLSLFNGETGELLDTVPYDPPRGRVADWGDSHGNRVDRFLAAIAYLDGENPSAVMCRGYYDRGRPTNLAAYDVVGKKLIKRWKFRADKNQNIAYTNQGNHNIAVGDVDGDGRDEIVYGACAIDHDGTGVYSTRLGHGDALHFGKFDPSTKGLDYMQVHEHGDCPYGLEVRNPATGEVLWGKFVGKDTGRGMTAKVDPRYPGAQVWSNYVEGIYTYQGEQITTVRPPTANFTVWWDGDLLRELLDHKWPGADPMDGRGGKKGTAVIYKWNWLTDNLDVLLDAQDAFSINGTKGNPCIQADIFGDWREEVIWRNDDDTALMIFTTNHPTEHKFYTLMHDPVYRMSVGFQNVCYNQPPHTGFYIGPDMGEIPVPEHNYTRGEQLPKFE